MKKAATQDQQDFAATLHAWVKSRVSTLDELEEVSGYNRCDLSRMSTGGRIANDFEIDCIMQAIGIIDARLCRTTAKEREMSEVKIDWKNAPDGATHYSKRFGEFYKAEDGFLLNYQNEQMRWIVLKDWHVDILNCEHLAMVKRPESITDVARSIEAARVEERDAVNNPKHYTTGGIECIDAMQAMLSREEFIGYLRGNIFKYQWRYKHKNGVEDLRKADWYAQRLVELEAENAARTSCNAITGVLDSEVLRYE